MEKKDLVTPEICSTFDDIYLIRINEEIIGFVNNETIAIPIINSIAATEIDRLQRPTLKILRQDFQGGKEVHICTQSLGKMWNGKIKRVLTIDMISTPKIKYNGPTI